MSHRLLISTVLLGASSFAFDLLATDYDVVISEIHYNPLSNLAEDEFVELVNRGPTSVDIGGWRFSEGIDLVITPGTLLAPLERIIVSPNAAHALVRYGVARAIGNYTGRLDNDGEIVTLVNVAGDIVSRIHYADEGTWPSRPDGLGPSLEILDPHAQPDVGRSWASSLTIDGTPGAANSRELGDAPQSQVLVAAQDLWRYQKGTQEASNPRTAWTTTTYDDASWPTAAGGFGYGNQPFETELGDMPGSYSTLYLRARFTLSATELAQIEGGASGLTLTVRYDDAFVTYLNGLEVGRENALNAGTPPAFDALADASRATQAFVSLDAFTASLRVGTNVIAIHGLNNMQGSSDFFLEAELRLNETPPATQDEVSKVVLNEIKPTEPGSPGFIELYNSSATAFALSAHAILDSAGNRFKVPAATSVPARGRVVFTDAQLGFQLALSGRSYALVEQDQSGEAATFVDAINPRPGPAGATGLSFGRVADGGDDLYLLTSPSSGTANAVTLATAVVINEIHYHPPYVAPAGGCTRNCSDLLQWVELHNRGASTVNVAGWSLSKGVSLDIPATPALNLAANGYLVLASNRAAFLAAHPGFDPARVVGDWSRDLAHGSDTINLNDQFQNRIDHVKYGDGSPTNDNEPEDGVDDLTYLGSAWPRAADGTGRTLELVNPRLDNRDGHAWAAGPVDGTPGAQNSSFVNTPSAVIGNVEHSPAAPLPTETVRVKCRVSATQTITSVEALWHREGSAVSGTVPLRDDGLSDDGAAGDGVFAGSIPAQPDRAIVGFQVRARLQDGKQTVVPRSPQNPPYGGFVGPFFLYQTLAAAPPVNPSQNYLVVLTLADQAELESRPEASNVLLPCTFIQLGASGGSTVRHLAGIRYRGEQTRTDERKGYRINFPSEHAFEDIEHLNLVAAGVDRELLISDLFRRAGMPAPREWSVNLTFQGTLDPRYAAKEHLDSSFVTRSFGNGSDSGNFYRAVEPNGFPGSGNLTYYGEDPAAYVTNYEKRTNSEENDYSDLIELCRAFNSATTPDALFADTIANLIDVNQWARYFALQACISNVDGSIQTSSGEDYYLYHVPETSNRPDAGRWVLIPWDIEESFQNANEQLFRPQVPAIRRFLTHPRFAPYYYANLVNLRSGAFSRFETRQRFVLIDFLFGFGTIDGIDTFIANRIGFIDSNVPTELSAGAVSTAVGGNLIQVGDIWKYFKGTQAPPGGPVAWTQRAFADDSWLTGPTGIGYGDGDDATTLDDMQDSYSTFYARRSFSIANPATVTGLDLIIDYDDGFVAYLNGVEVARRNAPGADGTVVPFDATANDTREAGTPEIINISAFLNRLAAGNNVLSVQVLNATLDSSDVSFAPALVSDLGTSGGIGCGTVLYSTTDSLGLSGRANAYLTQSVTVNGTLASYNGFTATWTANVSGLVVGDNLVIVRAYEGPGAVGNIIESRTITIRRLTQAPTPISGSLSGVTQWTEAGGPYLMSSNVSIPAGSRLEIGPGTLIIGSAGASILVRGELRAVGTAAKPILFRALSCSNRWGGIALQDTGVAPGSPTHTLRYCDLEFGDQPAGYAGCVSPVNAKLLVEDCSFRFLTANAVDGTDARVEVRTSLFEKIAEGVHCTRSTVLVLNSTFRGMIGDKDGIDFDLNGPGERSRIEGNLIEDSSDDGIDLQETTVDIIKNVIRNVSDKAMSLEINGPLGAPTVIGNQVYNSGTGLALKSGVRVTDSHHNTFVGNQEGINLFAKAGASDGGHGIFHSMIVWNNIIDVKLDGLSDVSFTHSNISLGVFPGVGNISNDPKFVNVAGDNYALRPGSPCIGTGLAGTDMGAVPFTGGPVVFVRADSDRSETVNVTDVLFTLGYLFRSGPTPSCLDAADANDDAGIDISDAVFTLFYLFGGGNPPPTPFPAAGEDPTADGLGCG